MTAKQIDNPEPTFRWRIQEIEYVKDNLTGADLQKVINYTMMRVDLPKPLKPGNHMLSKLKWWYNINERAK